MQKEQQQLAELVKGKKVAFIGAGVSHKTLIEEFVGLGAHVTLCDKKNSVDDFGSYAETIRRLGIDLSLGEHYMDGFRGQDIILRTPGFEYYQKPLQDAIAAGTLVTSEVELFFDYCPCEIVGVTGSDGKTTTTTLTYKLLETESAKEEKGRRVFVGGNIGAPLLPRLAEMRTDDYAVVELSSFQLMTMQKATWAAAITNISPNHLNWHTDMEEYTAAKYRVLGAGTHRAVLNADNALSAAAPVPTGAEKIVFSLEKHPADMDGDVKIYEEDGFICMDGEKVLRIADIRHQLVADRIHERLVFLHHRAEFQSRQRPAHLLSVSSRSDEVQPLRCPSAHSYETAIQNPAKTFIFMIQ